MIKLSEISTRAPEGVQRKSIRKETAKISRRIGELLQLMYAERKHSLLVVLQGMDTSGKDGATSGVF